MTEKKETILSFKGFDADFKCRGFQFEVGGTYKHEGQVSACNSGFHACENPLDVLSYYPLVDSNGKESRFAEVEQSGATSRHNNDSKIASAEITIKAELKLPDFIRRAVNWMLEQVKPTDPKATTVASESYSKLAASGYGSKLAASGYGSQLAASGDGSKLAASGYGSQLAASGYGSKLAASGDGSQLAASGKDSVIASSARNTTAKGADGTWIALAEFDGNGKCIGFAVGCVGGGIPADTWLKASGGKLVAA